MRRHRWVVVVLALPLVAGVVGCAGYRVEHNGKQLGDAICDLRNATTTDEATEALSDAQDAIADANRIVGRPVDEDVADIKENLSDLSEHVAADQTGLAQQDIAVIRRNVQAVIDVSTGRSQRFYQGLDQGLADCSDS